MKARENLEKLTVAAHQNKKERDYWLNQLAGELVKSSFPYDFKYRGEENGKEIEPQTLPFRLNGDLCPRLMWLSSGSDHTLHVCLAAALSLLLEKYTYNKDIIVGVPIYKQESRGEFINTVVALRNRLQDHMTFKELLLQVSHTVIKAVENQGYPIEILLNQLNIQDSDHENGFPLFDVVVLLENIHDRTYIRHINPNMIFSFSREGEQIEGVVEYNPLTYREATVQRIVKHLENLLQKVLFDVDVPLERIDILSEKERNDLLQDFSKPWKGNGRNRYTGFTIHRLFEQQAAKVPDSIAVVFGDKNITFRALNARANQAAHLLRHRGILPGDIIGLMMERSVEMIVGILGILKAGAAYLPLDPAMPGNRNLAVLEDSRVPLLLTKSAMIEDYPFTALQDLKMTAAAPQVTARRPQIRDLDHLPLPDRSLVDYRKYHRSIGVAMAKHTVSIMGTRGCPYNCAYCHKIWPKKHVTRSAENIFREIKQCYQAGARRFVLIDDIFNLDKENGSRLYRMILEKGLDIQLFFPGGVRGDILTKEYIDLMIEAGTVNMMLALETACPRLQKLVGKHQNLEKFAENLRYIVENYPQVILEMNIMHGFPTETEEEAMMSLEFLKRYRWIHFPNLNILKIFPNTDMYRLAVENGIPAAAIERSANLGYHELPDTLPFPKSFTRQYQARFMDEYFRSKERLLHVLPYQMKILTEDELVQKYESYLPIDVKRFSDILDFAGITHEELGDVELLQGDPMAAPDFSENYRRYFSLQPCPDPADAYRILFLDLSQHFSSQSGKMLYDVVAAPLGLMYLKTYLDEKFPGKIHGKVVKSRIDFNSYEELKTLLDDFKPQLICVRTLTYFKEFFHRTVSLIRQWGIRVPVIAGGPYASSDYMTMLHDRSLDLAVLGEGELTLAQLVDHLLKNNKKLPGEEVLQEIQGIAFIRNRDKNRLKETNREILLLDKMEQELVRQPVENLDHHGHADDLCYAIYTSGSTGKPNGTLTSHQNVIRVVRDTNYIDLVPSDKVLQLSNYAFDGSVFDIYGALLNGAALVLVEKEDVLAVDKLSDLIEKERVSVFFVTTALFNALVDVKIDCFDRIRAVLFGGERVSVKHTRKALEHLGKGKSLHMYGPTETTVYATYYPVKKIDERLGTVPIGRPISDTFIYILDQSMKPVPIGVCGEVYIGGTGVARGYLNNPELTGEKFMTNPFVSGDKLYRTGDLARWLPDKNVEFIDRVDYQVKIRGFRVELGEIESRLLEREEIKEAVVVAIEDTERCLCAYLVADEQLRVPELREYLAGELPDNMIPSYFMQIPKIPLTPNGKIDKRALPQPEARAGNNYLAPTGEIEQMLADIFREVLAIERVGSADDFFELGGDSIKAIQLSARLNKRGYKIEISDLFVNPTVKELAGCVKVNTRVSHQGIVEGEVELTPIQQWFFQNIQTDRHHVNQSVMVYRKEKFDETLLEKVFTKIVEHHDALRMVYEVHREGQQERVVQRNRGLEGKLFHLDIFDFKNSQNVEEEIEREANRLQASIDLAKGPLVKAALFKTSEGDHLLMVIHHLVVDGVSWRILLEDFSKGYEMAQKGEIIQFQNKTDSFKQWAGRLKENKRLNQLEYWKTVEETEVEPLPKDNEAAKHQKKVKNSQTIIVTLDEKETETLLKGVNHAYNTDINDILLTALALAIREWAGSRKILINLEGHGREPIIEGIDISRTVGWFTSQFPLLLDMNSGNNPGELGQAIVHVKETLRRVPDKGIDYGILRYLTPTGFTLEPGISFNYLGQFFQENGSGLFELSTEKMGNSMSPEAEMKYLLDVRGITVKGRLRVSFVYNRYEYRRVNIERLAGDYKAYLLSIIRHCSQKQEGELTLSDYAASDLDEQEVEDLFEELETNSE